MLTLDDYRLDASQWLPDPVHPESLVTAIEEVASKDPLRYDESGDSGAFLGNLAVELGIPWQEVLLVEFPYVDGLNDLHTPGAPLRITGEALEYWNLLDALVSQGWTWGVVAKAIRRMYENNHTEHPPF